MIAFRIFRDITGRLPKLGQTTGRLPKLGQTRNWHASFHSLLAIMAMVDISQYNARHQIRLLRRLAAFV